MHGTARVMVKDYGEKRARELRRRYSDKGLLPKVDHAKELTRLAMDSRKYGTVVMGPSPDGPVH